MKTKQQIGSMCVYVGEVLVTYSDVELPTIQPERMEEVTIRKTCAVGKTEFIHSIDPYKE